MKNESDKKEVSGAQNISSKCFVCGIDNELSLRTQFLNLEDGSICALFTTRQEHQGYPGRIHGGVVSAILDEAIGRAIQATDPDVFGVTIELSVKFRKPAPIGEQLRVFGRIDRQTKRVFEGSGELLLPDGTVAAQAHAKYLRVDVDRIVEGGLAEIDWVADDRPVPKTIEALSLPRGA